ncbi:MAG: preprotein translocase subunit SecG [Candidatus Yanofskybacteria bacterium RIFCSPHIGHO2_12_FULL_41_9]|nr:MAG: preprotein translocase subunit SecG [Candidatus Yanofskybacteria bacterium RIFCSPHIGHO2_12_FULL_41_9]
MITYAQIIISALLIVTILLQQKGGGLSGAFGGGMMEYSTRRGAERGIFYASIILAVLFLGLSVTRLLL